MNTRLFQQLGRVSLAAALALSSTMAANNGGPALLAVDGGSVSFDAPTNISAVSVHGKSSALAAQVRVRRGDKELIVDEVSAKLPIESLTTGMGLRDEHMKKYIFTAPDGRQPELSFTGANIACPMESGAKETNCKFPGKLSIRGVERPVTIALKIRPEGGGSAPTYRASGDGTVKLSDFGIERPSQFGVKCADEVKIHFEFQGRETAQASARLEAAR